MYVEITVTGGQLYCPFVPKRGKFKNNGHNTIYSVISIINRFN